MAMRFSVVLEGVEYPVEVDEALRVRVGERAFKARVEVRGPTYRVVLGRKRYDFTVEGRRVALRDRPLDVIFAGHDFSDSRGRPEGLSTSGEVVRAPMPGRVVGLVVREGEKVSVGSPLLILEAMKMQNEVPSPSDGVVKEIMVSRDSAVAKDDPLVVIQ